MRIAGKDYLVQPVPRHEHSRPAVQLQVKAYGMCLAQEICTPDEARQLARLLDAAADQAEGRAL